MFDRRTGSGRHPSGGETSGEGSVRPGGTHPPQLPAATQQVRQAPPPPPLPENGVGLRNRTAVLRQVCLFERLKYFFWCIPKNMLSKRAVFFVTLQAKLNIIYLNYFFKGLKPGKMLFIIFICPLYYEISIKLLN